jgi:hypothetical protein
MYWVGRTLASVFSHSPTKAFRGEASHLDCDKRRNANRILDGVCVAFVGGHPTATSAPRARQCRFFQLDLLHATPDHLPIIGDCSRHGVFLRMTSLPCVPEANKKGWESVPALQFWGASTLG